MQVRNDAENSYRKLHPHPFDSHPYDPFLPPSLAEHEEPKSLAGVDQQLVVLLTRQQARANADRLAEAIAQKDEEDVTQIDFSQEVSMEHNRVILEGTSSLDLRVETAILRDIEVASASSCQDIETLEPWGQSHIGF